jgi:hypothetical protein
MKCILLTITSIIFFSCSSNIARIYSKAVLDASHPSTKKIDSNLTIISDTNSTLERKPGSPGYIKVVSLRADTKYLDLDGEGFFQTKNKSSYMGYSLSSIEEFF